MPNPGIYMNRNSTHSVMNQAELIELIDGCLKEDRRTQELLYKRYSNRMWGVCLRYSRSREEAEDILQEGFMKVFDNIGKFKFEGSFEGWVRRIMVNTALRHYNKSVFKEEKLANDDEEIDALVDPAALANISEKELLRVIDELPEGYRVVFNLYVIEGYDHKEIAEMLGIAESTSRSQLTKARLMLQKRLNKDKKQNKLFLFFLMTAGTDPFDEQVRRKLVNYSPEAPSHVWNNIIEQRSFYYRMMRLLRRNGLTFGLILLFTGLLAGVSYSFISGESAYAQRNEAAQPLLAFNTNTNNEQDNLETLFSDNAEAGQTPVSFTAFSGNNGSYEWRAGEKSSYSEKAGAKKNDNAGIQARREHTSRSGKEGSDRPLKHLGNDIAAALNGNIKGNVSGDAAGSGITAVAGAVKAGNVKVSQQMKVNGMVTTPSVNGPGAVEKMDMNEEQVMYAAAFTEGFVPVSPQLPGPTIDSIGGGENATPIEPTKTGRETWRDRLTLYVVAAPLVVKKSIRANDEAFNELCTIRNNTERMNMGFTAGALGELRITPIISMRTGMLYTRFTSTFDHTVSSTETRYNDTTYYTYIVDPFEPVTPVLHHDTIVTEVTEHENYTSANSYTSWNIPVLVQSQFGYRKLKLYSSIGPMVNVSFMQKGMLVNSDRQVADISEQEHYRKSFNVLLYAGAGCRYAFTKRISVIVEPHYTYNLNSLTVKGAEFKQNFHAWGMMTGIGIDL